MARPLFRRFACFVGLPAAVVALSAAAHAAVVTQRVSVSSSDRQITRFGGFGGVLSGDGRLVVFTSRARHLVFGDTNRKTDVFLRNRRTGRTFRVSVADDGAQPNGFSSDAILSADGRFVVFSSEATNLRPNGLNDRNGHFDDVYIRDRFEGRTRLVSRNQAGAQGTFGDSLPLDVSADGRYILFSTNSKNFKPLRGVSSLASAVYLRDMVRGRTYWIPGSVNTGAVLGGAVSDDGRIVAYTVISNGRPRRTNLYDRNTDHTAHLRCRVISCLVVTLDDLSPSGRFVLMEGHGHILREDRRTHAQVIASAAPHGNPEDGESTGGRITAGGKVVLFLSSSTNLVAGDTNGQWDEFRANLRLGTMTRVDLSSTGAQIADGIDPSFSGCLRGDSISDVLLAPAISRDGTVATFATKAAGVVPGDTNGLCDVFVRAGLSG